MEGYFATTMPHGTTLVVGEGEKMMEFLCHIVYAQRVKEETIIAVFDYHWVVANIATGYW